MAIEGFIIDCSGRAGEGWDPWFMAPDFGLHRTHAATHMGRCESTRYKLTDNLVRCLVEWLGDVVDASRCQYQ